MLLPAALSLLVAGLQDSLLVDIGTGPPPGPEVGEALFDGSRPVGSAGGRLWVTGARAGVDTRVWYLEDTGVLEPLELPTLGYAGANTGSLHDVEELPGGAVVLLAGVRLLVWEPTDSTVVDLGLQVDLSAYQGPFGGAVDSRARAFQVLGTRAYCVALGPQGTPALYSTDGTIVGTVLEEDFGSGDFQVGPLWPLGSTFCFLRRPQSGSVELRSFAPGAGSSSILATTVPATPDLDPIAVGGQLVFAWRQSGVGTEFWRTDGTPGGTHLLLDANPGAASSTPVPIAGDSKVGYFAALTAEAGRELWKTDGTGAGTVQVADIRPGPSGMVSLGFIDGAAVSGGIVFPAASTQNNLELWFSDGTEAGTAALLEIGPGEEPGTPQDLTPVSGGVAFTARTAATGREVWITDGTGDGTLPTPEVEPGPGSASSDVFALVEHSSTVHFTYRFGAEGEQIYRATTASSQFVGKTGQIAQSASSDLGPFIRAADHAFFLADSGPKGDPQLWTSDGTVEGTRMVDASLNADPSLLGVLDSGLVYVLQPGSSPDDVLKYSTGEPGSDLVLAVGGGFEPIAGLEPKFADAQIGNAFYFAAVTDSDGVGLWRTDGTPAGTALVAALNPGGPSGIFSAPARVGQRVVFEGFVGAGIKLYRSDGSSVGTQPLAPDLLKNVTPDLGIVVDDTYVFSAGTNPPFAGSELWRTDGTDGGTVRIGEFSPGISALAPAGQGVLLLSPPRLLWVGLAGSVQVLIEDANGIGNRVTLLGQEYAGRSLIEVEPGLALPPGLYAYDGALPGLALVSDQAVSGPAGSLGSGGAFLFDRVGSSSGREAWVSGPAPDVIGIAGDLAPGIPSGAPEFGSRAGGSVLLSAFRIEEGRELHAIDIVAAGGFVAEPFGEGCGQAGPRLNVEGQARLGSPIEFVVSRFQPSGMGRLYLGLSSGAEEFGGCRIYLDAPLLTVASFKLDEQGEARVAMRLPGDPALLGLPLFLQAAGTGPGGPGPGGLELSDGVELRIGMP